MKLSDFHLNKSKKNNRNFFYWHKRKSHLASASYRYLMLNLVFKILIEKEKIVKLKIYNLFAVTFVTITGVSVLKWINERNLKRKFEKLHVDFFFLRENVTIE